MNIYIASSEEYVEKIQEDIYLRDAYNQKGFCCKIFTLKNIVEVSKSFDIVILKSIWGYHLRYKEFLKQLLVLKKNNIKLINDYDFIFWNIDKYRYLSELKSINTVPTEFLSFKNAKNTADIKGIIVRASKILNTDILVIKPCISESGYLTLKYDKTKDNIEVISLIQNNKKLKFIAQPYRSGILAGELSVVMIDGIPMYVFKRFPGVFTKNKSLEYIDRKKISKQVAGQIKLLNNFFIDKFKSLPKICRVDFVKNNSSYELMEIELIDPDLFFRLLPKRVLNKCLVGLINA